MSRLGRYLGVFTAQRPDRTGIGERRAGAWMVLDDTIALPMIWIGDELRATGPVLGRAALHARERRTRRARRARAARRVAR